MAAAETPLPSRPAASGRGRGPLLAGALAAMLASACCLGPLLLALGISGAWIGKLALLDGDCCVFRSYGTVPRPTVQAKRRRDARGGPGGCCG